MYKKNNKNKVKYLGCYTFYKNKKNKKKRGKKQKKIFKKSIKKSNKNIM